MGCILSYKTLSIGGLKTWMLPKFEIFETLLLPKLMLPKMLSILETIETRLFTKVMLIKLENFNTWLSKKLIFPHFKNFETRLLLKLKLAIVFNSKKDLCKNVSFLWEFVTVELYEACKSFHGRETLIYK